MLHILARVGELERRHVPGATHGLGARLVDRQQRFLGPRGQGRHCGVKGGRDAVAGVGSACESGHDLLRAPRVTSVSATRGNLCRPC